MNNFSKKKKINKKYITNVYLNEIAIRCLQTMLIFVLVTSETPGH